MARKLKTYQTSLGFFGQAIAAPSMKAALEAWGAPTAIFSIKVRQKRAPIRKSSPRPWQSRAWSSNVPWDMTGPSASTPNSRRISARMDGRRPLTSHQRRSLLSSRTAACREREEAKEEAAQEKERERRQQAVAKAQAALDEAMREHDERAATLNEERDALDQKSQAEDERWALEEKKLESALRRARD
jgi:hypothetical protein